MVRKGRAFYATLYQEVFLEKQGRENLYLDIDLNLLGHPKMESFLFIVVKLFSYIDSDVGNVLKNKYFAIILNFFHMFVIYVLLYPMLHKLSYLNL